MIANICGTIVGLCIMIVGGTLSYACLHDAFYPESETPKGKADAYFEKYMQGQKKAAQDEKNEHINAIREKTHDALIGNEWAYVWLERFGNMYGVDATKEIELVRLNWKWVDGIPVFIGERKP